jgi:hypothetical protein
VRSSLAFPDREFPDQFLILPYIPRKLEFFFRTLAGLATLQERTELHQSPSSTPTSKETDSEAAQYEIRRKYPHFIPIEPEDGHHAD